MTDWDLDRMMRQWSGKTFDQETRHPSPEETIERYWQTIGSKKPLRSLGWASDGETLLSEEARESHIHILGAPGEGKSKFIEMLVEQDIRAGYGACVLDPSDDGDTCYKILKYCAKHGYEKVILIDPHDAFTFNKLPTIHPFHYYKAADGSRKPDAGSVGNIMDTVRVLWGSRVEETPKINKYLPAILNVLHASKMTLHEALYFTEKTHPYYKLKREAMLDALHPVDRSRVALESAYAKPPTLFASEMDSTFRRLDPFFDDVMKLMVGSTHSPINFPKLVADGWVILINLDPTGVWGKEQQRLLGTLVVNEIMNGINRLMANGWRGTYNVYIDEVGDYATQKLADMLDKKRKTGLRFCLAHQRFDQIEDKNVLSSVMGSTKIKALFYTPNRDDRDKMLRSMYGGDIPDRQVSHVLGQLKKQEAAIKINKQPPRITRLPDVPDIEIDPKVFKAFKEKILQHECYRSPAELLDEINARLKTPTKTVRPEQSGEFRESRQPTRSRKAVAERSTKVDRRTDSEARPSAPKRRPAKSVFSEEED